MLYWVNQFAVAPDQPGGTRHFEMSRELVRQGMPTTVVASDLSYTARRYLRRDGVGDRRHIDETIDDVDFAWLPAGNYESNDWRRALSMVIFSAHAFLFLMRAKMPKGSVIIGSSPHLLAAAAARMAAALRRRPFVLEVRDLWPESLEVGGEKPGLLHRALRLVADVLYRTSRTIIVLAAGNAGPIADRGVPADRISYVPNGVDPADFVAAKPTSVPRLPSGRSAFVYAGAHGPANGLETVLDAAAELKRRGDERIQVVLIGDGPVKAALVADAAERQLTNVSFVDPVAKASIPGILKAACGGIMPLADVELFSFGVSPNKLFDYLSAGLPVVNNVPGDVARMVDESRAGINVPPADPAAMAEAMQRIVDGETFDSGLAWIELHHDRVKLAGDLRQLLVRA